jgi:FAD/FMN-containing dehydrogenase
MIALQPNVLAEVDCEVAFDNLTRQLYATDASIYQIEPIAVAFPRSARQASAVIRAAADASIAITPPAPAAGWLAGRLAMD